MITCRNHLKNTRVGLFADRIFRPACQRPIFTFVFRRVHQFAHRFDDMPTCNLHKFHLSCSSLLLPFLFAPSLAARPFSCPSQSPFRMLICSTFPLTTLPILKDAPQSTHFHFIALYVHVHACSWLAEQVKQCHRAHNNP